MHEKAKKVKQTLKPQNVHKKAFRGVDSVDGRRQLQFSPVVHGFMNMCEFSSNAEGKS